MIMMMIFAANCRLLENYILSCISLFAASIDNQFDSEAEHGTYLCGFFSADRVTL